MTEPSATITNDAPTQSDIIIADDETAKGDSVDSNNSYEELRRLLIAPEQQKLQHLEKRINNPPPVPANEVGQVLPAAVTISTKQDNALAHSMQPVVEEDIRLSVRRNPQVLADALFPVIGPAIRKAIAEALSAMVQSLNQTLEHSFSAQGMKWRLEAMRTGRPYGEVVLLHTLVYKVEQVFLIHKETGLLLQHVVAGSAVVQDADMVSGMLTAIQDFVHDSFTSTEQSALDTLHVGDLTVWVEQGPRAVLAGVIRGTPPQEARQVFQSAIESIHFDMSEELETFDGNAAPFERCRPQLEECLLMQYSQPLQAKKKISPFQILAGALCLILLVVGFFYVRHYLRWQNYLERLRNEPGVVVTSEERGWFKDSIEGLRDPLAKDPVKLLPDSKLDESKVVSDWRPYISVEPPLVIARAKTLLNAPSSVDFTFADGVLKAKGNASPQWVEQAQRLAQLVPGVTRFDASGLGPTEIARLKNKIEDVVIRFEPDTEKLLASADETLDELVSDVEKLFTLATSEGKTVQLEITGHTDNRGTEETNQQLSQKRAEEVRKAIAKLSPQLTLKTIAAGNKQPVKTELSAQDMEINRSVTIKVIIN
jgi:OOP family OmpA-OmpF porin